MFFRLAILAAGLSTVLAIPTVAERDTAVTIGGTHTGDGKTIECDRITVRLRTAGTFYAPGLGACGVFNTASDLIVAIGHDLFDNYP